ncbi:aminotransferase class V-fold PLP-dependent enzyme [Flavobacterium sp. J49]|uniref:aminotransferase class V-fold PLP-dependent enzyme n=1 Tax=Flavobacterium sp. J49 TaxID=2718534 RepID=UPI001592D3ED|nr:aminotransferase class V-fold PLP-dependent enzyme [Flavobacterium sp. J49]MBF6641937.1 aminotransferase class V-fold PLP-dependent enzyme [Flavobacterium sp. J49]NIC03184.1 aminotransferase class V-fold PLP-dependent enzyme [Flavobacterium sp. J49]
MKSQFLLDPSVTFLNHGSFGACPKPIFEAYQRFQLELEKEPVVFIQKKLPQYLKQAKAPLAEFIGCEAEDFFFVPNPTVAINTVMRSLKLQSGDEILATNHEYGAMDRTWNFYCKKSGAKYVRQSISLPIVSKEQIIEEFWKGYNSNTKVVFLNQMSSSTALIFPVKEICDKAQELGLITIVDGAHIPGHIDLNLTDLNPDFYTGTLHKWMLAPKGSSFLYVKKEFQAEIDPLVVSWGYESLAPSDSQFLDYHEYQGTNDHSAFLCTPKVIEFLEQNNWKEKSKACKEIVFANYQRFCDLLKTQPLAPITEEFLGQMASIPVKTSKPAELKDLLYDQYKIQIPVMPLNGDIYLRYSINAYNSQEDLDILYRALEDIIKTTDLIEI